MDLSKNALGFRTAFFFGHPVQRPDKIFLNLSSSIPEFDAMPSIQPLPEGIQSDNFPIVRLRSESNIFHCEISQSRIDFIIRLEDKFESFNYNAIYSEYKRLSIELLKYLTTQTTIPVSRTGLVVSCFVGKDSPSLAVSLVEQCTGSSHDEDAIELSVRSNRRHFVNDVPCNDIRLFEVAQIQSNGNRLGGVILERDINTAVINEVLAPEVLQAVVESSLDAHSLDNFTQAMTK